MTLRTSSSDVAPCRHSYQASLAQGHHPVGDRRLVDVLGVGVLDDHALDLLVHVQDLVYGEAARIAGLAAHLAPFGAE